MSHPALLVIGILRALVEVALLFLIGQGILALLASSRRHANIVYKFFLIVTQPVMKIVRFIAPPQIIDKHVPFVAFFVLFWCWIGLAYLKKVYCEVNLLQCF